VPLCPLGLNDVLDAPCPFVVGELLVMISTVKSSRKINETILADKPHHESVVASVFKKSFPLNLYSQISMGTALS